VRRGGFLELKSSLPRRGNWGGRNRPARRRRDQLIGGVGWEQRIGDSVGGVAFGAEAADLKGSPL